MSRPVALSRLAVGSSARTSAGSPTSARAIATRCCWPPESSGGRWRARSRRPTCSSAAATRARRSRPSRGWISSGYSTFSHAVSTGMRLNVWKTNPSLRALRSARAPADSALTASPSMRISPEVGVSRQPMRLSSVLLPLPDGPAMATNSPVATLNETSSSAVTPTLPSRYVLLTCSTATRSSIRVPPGPGLVRLALTMGRGARGVHGDRTTGYKQGTNGRKRRMSWSSY